MTLDDVERMVQTERGVFVKVFHRHFDDQGGGIWRWYCVVDVQGTKYTPAVILAPVTFEVRTAPVKEGE